MTGLLLALTARRYTALGMGGAFLLGSVCGLDSGPWWLAALVSLAATAVIVLAVEGLRLLAYRWLRNHPAREA